MVVPIIVGAASDKDLLVVVGMSELTMLLLLQMTMLRQLLGAAWHGTY